MTTRAEIHYWRPSTIKVLWYSDGYPEFVLFEEIIPMILAYKEDKGEYLLMILDSEIAPSDYWFDCDYRYEVMPVDANEDVFSIEVNGIIIAKVDTYNKEITIFREGLKKIGYEDNDFTHKEIPKGYTLTFS